MRYLGIFLLFSINGLVFSQKKYVPFAEAKKATASVENATEIRDSLKRCYERRWSLDFYYGQRFISPANHTERSDSITLTDFTNKHGFFGIGTSYFLKDRIMFGGTIYFLFLPREQDISNFGGTGGSGTGSGGLSMNFELSGRYYFKGWKNSRPYISAAVGRYQLVAKGGSIDFSIFSGRDEDIESLNAQMLSASISGGISHRFALSCILDFNFGYTVTSRSVPIGGITSPGGINSSASLRFILNPKKKKNK